METDHNGTSATIEVDVRGRVVLGKATRPGTYRVSTCRNGSIVLEPVDNLTATELAIIRNSKLAADLNATFAGTLETVDIDWENR